MEKQELWSLTYVFCSDEYLLDINKEYLNHDYFTDIITFNLANTDQPVEGEIYISLDRVKENAQKLGQSYKDELHRVIFHGALHLCGFKDKALEEQTRMRKKEDEYLDLYFG
jgi:rRNA maturation RNase YbeY